MNERIREVRKSLGLTLEKFGERLGVNRASISNIETGKRNVTEQMSKAICREFGVDPYWLETGNGEMFLKTDDAFLEKIDLIMAGENEFHKNLVKMTVNLDTEKLILIESMIRDFLELEKEN